MMKLFRKSKALSSGVDNNVTIDQKESQRVEKAKPVLQNKEESQRLFMKQLYHLSQTHASASKSSSNNDGSSPSAEPVTPTCGTQETPEKLLPKRTIVDDTQELPELIGCSTESMLSQLLACTSDFFGDRIADVRYENPDLPHRRQPPNLVSMNPPVPTTITVAAYPVLNSSSVSPQDLAGVPHHEMPAPDGEGLFRPNILLFADKAIVDGVEELDKIVDSYERSSIVEEKKDVLSHPSSGFLSTNYSYYRKPSRGQGTSIADNVWVVSLDEDDPPSTPCRDDLSMTSSIPTRHSHRLH